MVAMAFSAKAVTVGADASVNERISYSSYFPYIILIVIAALLDLLALTTYKFRVFQMRTAGLSAIITLALQIWLAVDFIATHDVVVFRLTAVFPLISIILNVLAMRGILADEMLVESAYHLRNSKKRKR